MAGYEDRGVTIIWSSCIVIDYGRVQGCRNTGVKLTISKCATGMQAQDSVQEVSRNGRR